MSAIKPRFCFHLPVLADFGGLNIMGEALNFVTLNNADFLTFLNALNALNETIGSRAPIAPTYKDL